MTAYSLGMRQRLWELYGPQGTAYTPRILVVNYTLRGPVWFRTKFCYSPAGGARHQHTRSARACVEYWLCARRWLGHPRGQDADVELFAAHRAAERRAATRGGPPPTPTLVSPTHSIARTYWSPPHQVIPYEDFGLRVTYEGLDNLTATLAAIDMPALKRMRRAAKVYRDAFTWRREAFTWHSGDELNVTAYNYTILALCQRLAEMRCGASGCAEGQTLPGERGARRAISCARHAAGLPGASVRRRTPSWYTPNLAEATRTLIEKRSHCYHHSRRPDCIYMPPASRPRPKYTVSRSIDEAPRRYAPRLSLRHHH